MYDTSYISKNLSKKSRVIGPIDSIMFVLPTSTKNVTEEEKLKSVRVKKYKTPEIMYDYIKTIEKRIQLINQHFLRKNISYHFDLTGDYR